MITNYQAAKTQNREALRRGLLDAASRILVNEGLEALKMRRVAEEVQASTQVLYTLFGNKEGLFKQLYLEGFKRLKHQLDAVTNDHPLDRLLNLGRAYRAFATANPTYFGVLFSYAIPGFAPSPETIQDAQHSFDVFEQAVQQAIETGLLAQVEPAVAAKVFFTSIHGAISLELIGYLTTNAENPELSQQIFEMTMSNALRGLS